MHDQLRALMYEVQYKDYSSDLKMYASLLEKHITVIEFGSGTGRITEYLLNNGYRVYGIEKEESYREHFSNKIAGSETRNNFSYISATTDIPGPCNIIFPFNVLFYLNETELINELDKLKNHAWNKVIFETDNIDMINKDNLKSKAHYHAGYDFKEHIFRSRSKLLVKNEVIYEQNVVSQFEYPLHLHKASYLLSLFESLSTEPELLGDFEMNPYNIHSPKLIAVLLKT